MPAPTLTDTGASNGRNIRVLVLATSYPLGPQDSASVFLRYLSENLHQQGAEVHVLAPAATKGGYSLENGIHVYRFRYMLKPWQKLCYGSGILPNLKRQPLLWLVVPYFLTGFIMAALMTVMRIKPDIIHGHWVIPTGVVGLIASQLFDTPFVVTAHGGDAFSMRSGLLARIKRYVVQRSQAWTANTLATAQAIDSSVANSRRHIIPMGVDTELFSVATGSRHTESKTQHILFVGRLVTKKGVNVLLEAISLLPEAEQNAILVTIAGDGAERPALQEQARQLGIGERVRFTGFVANADLPALFRSADVFVGPSVIDSSGDTEGQGVVFLEAMACGVPVIASQVGGIGEVIENGVSGLLVPAGDADQLAAGIRELLNNEDRRKMFSVNGRRRIENHFSWPEVSARFIALYKTLIP